MTREEIKSWLDEHNITNYIIKDDLTVDVDTHIYLSNKDFISIPVKFGHVSGDFNCYNNPKLTSLEHCPSTVGRDFNCSNNPKLTSLEHCPSTVGGDFYCSNNPKLDINDNRFIYIKGKFICDEGFEKSKTYINYLVMKKMEQI